MGMGIFSEKNNKCHIYSCYIFVCSFGKQCPNYTQPEKLEQRQVNNDLETGNLQISVKSARRMVLSWNSELCHWLHIYCTEDPSRFSTASCRLRWSSLTRNFQMSFKMNQQAMLFIPTGCHVMHAIPIFGIAVSLRIVLVVIQTWAPRALWPWSLASCSARSKSAQWWDLWDLQMKQMEI